MALAAGDRLGPYEILAPLGAGGMGEVYRAIDTKLSREVAIKVLPFRLSVSPESLIASQQRLRSFARLRPGGVGSATLQVPASCPRKKSGGQLS